MTWPFLATSTNQATEIRWAGQITLGLGRGERARSAFISLPRPDVATRLVVGAFRLLRFTNTTAGLHSTTAAGVNRAGMGFSGKAAERRAAAVLVPGQATRSAWAGMTGRIGLDGRGTGELVQPAIAVASSTSAAMERRRIVTLPRFCRRFDVGANAVVPS